jgi:DNA topoisomerase-1
VRNLYRYSKVADSDNDDESSDDDEEDDDDGESSSDDDEPIGSLMKKKPAAKKSPGAKAKKVVDADEPWKAKKGAKKMWTTLEHSGVVFPPAYDPHGVPLVYDGEDVKLLPHEEEVCTFFAVGLALSTALFCSQNTSSR